MSGMREAVDNEPWQFESVERHPTGFGVALLVSHHRYKGKLSIPLSREDCRQVAMQALAAMEPADEDEP